MDVLTQDHTRETNIPNRDILLLRLERNQREIVQLVGKLESYICEPHTYDQYAQLNLLRDKAKLLRDVIKNICVALKFESNSTVRCSGLLIAHLQNFKTFSKEVVNYMGEVKLHCKAHV